MSKLIRNQNVASATFDPFIDPVSYLASLGIEAELVSLEKSQLAEAA